MVTQRVLLFDQVKQLFKTTPFVYILKYGLVSNILIPSMGIFKTGTVKSVTVNIKILPSEFSLKSINKR